MNTYVVCSQCGQHVRVSEPYAFGGMDRLRATLSCGHVVLRDSVGKPLTRVRAALVVGSRVTDAAFVRRYGAAAATVGTVTRVGAYGDPAMVCVAWDNPYGDEIENEDCWSDELVLA